MPVILNLEDKIISLIRNERYKWFTTGVNLGGVTGASGGTGTPIGGFIGQLVQSKVTYDTTEAESMAVPISGASLVHNLNRIRYRLAQVEAGSGIDASGISYISIWDESIPQGNVTILDFQGAGVETTVSGSVATITVTATGSGGAGHDAVTVVDTSSLNLELTGQALSGYVLDNSHSHVEANITDLEHDAVKIQGRNVSSVSPTQGQALAWNAISTQWEPQTVSGGGLGGTGLAYSLVFEDLTSQVPDPSGDYWLSQILVSGTLQIHKNGLLQQPDNYAETSTSGFHTYFSLSSGDELMAQYLVTISGTTEGTITVQEDDAEVANDVTILNFEGDVNTVDEGSGKVTIIVSGGGGAGHDAVTVVDTSSLNLELTDQALSGYVIESGVDHDQLLNFEVNEHFTEASIDHVNIQNIGSNTHSDIDAHIASGYIHTPSGHIHDNRYYTETEVDSLLHSEVTVVDTTSLNLELTDQALSGYVIPSGISHTEISDIGSNTHVQIDTHIADTTIHFDELTELSDVEATSPADGEALAWRASANAWVPSGLGGGTGHDAITIEDTASLNLELTGQALSGYVLEAGVDHDQLLNFEASEHFTEASIDHTNIQNIGTNSHADIDTHLASGSIHFTEGSISHLNIQDIGTNSHATIDSHIADTTIHFDELGELSDVSVAGAVGGHALVYDGADWVPSGLAGGHDPVTVVDTASLNLEITDQAISGYVIPSGVDHDQLSNTHNLTTDIDHDQLTNFTTTEHFTEASIDHTNIQNIGSNTHTQLDAHVASGSIHFTEASISHLNIQDIGTNSHSAIDSHIADTAIHFDELGELSDVSVAGSVQGEVLTHDGINWVPSGVSGATHTHDHGNLTGLLDNDHPQYALSGHLHDDRYYTKTLADNTFAASGHLHDDRYYTETEIDVWKHDAITVVDTSSLNLELTGQALSGYVLDNSHSHTEINISDLEHDAVKLQGRAISTEAPDTNDSLAWNGSQWAPIAISGGSGTGETLILEDITNQVPDTGDDFWLSNTLISGSLRVYINGLIQQPNNYAETSASGFHTYFSPISGDELLAEYLVQDVVGSTVVGTIQVEKDDAVIQQRVAVLNFEGSGVQSVTDEGNNKVTVSISGGGSGTSDHGALTGLSDDDHTQYAHLSQSESILGQWNFHSNLEQRGYYTDSAYTKTTISGGLYHVTDSLTGFDSTAVIRGNVVNIQGNSGQELVELDPSEITFNDPGNDVDFRVKGDTDQNLLFIDAGTNRVGIGTNSPQELLHVDGDILSSGSAVKVIGTKPSFELYNAGETYSHAIVASGSYLAFETHGNHFGADQGQTSLEINSADGPRFFRYTAGVDTPQSSATFTTKTNNATAPDGFGSKMAFRVGDENNTLHWQGGLAYAQDFTNDRSEAQLMIKSGATDTYATTKVMEANYAEVVFNDIADDRDFRVEAVGEANALFVQGSDGRVGIGTNSLPAELTINGGIRVRNPSSTRYRIDLQTSLIPDATFTAYDDTGITFIPFAISASEMRLFPYSIQGGGVILASGSGRGLELYSTSVPGYPKTVVISPRAGDSTIFNESGEDIDFRIEGTSDTQLFYVDAGNNIVNVEQFSVHDYIDIEDQTEPSTPSTGYGRIYVNNDIPYYKDDSGTNYSMVASGGTGSSGQTVFDVDNTFASQNNSTAWHEMYSVTIPAGTLGANDVINIKVYAGELNNSGTTRTMQRRWSINGTDYQADNDSQGTSGATRPDLAEIWIWNNNSTSAQRYWMKYSDSHNQLIHGTTAINTATTDLTIDFDQRWTNADSNQYTYTWGGKTLIITG
jgi:hypothetical protein